MNIVISEFNKNNEKFKKQLAEMLTEAFPHSYCDCVSEEVESCLKDSNIAIIATINNNLVGFIGGIPQYYTTGWELHPIIVKKEHQFKGIGTLLIKALEKEILSRGGITVYLGADDEFNKTSLSNTNLWENLYQKIEDIKNIKNHPYEFYQKMGYKIVGVIPDANGYGKPDIIMAKRINQNL